MISQTALDHFRTSLSEKKDDPYSVLLRRNKLPMVLLDDAQNPHTLKACFFTSFGIFFGLCSCSDHILSKLSPSRILLALKRNGNGPELMLARLRNLVNLVLLLPKRQKLMLLLSVRSIMNVLLGVDSFRT